MFVVNNCFVYYSKILGSRMFNFLIFVKLKKPMIYTIMSLQKKNVVFKFIEMLIICSL